VVLHPTVHTLGYICCAPPGLPRPLIAIPNAYLENLSSYVTHAESNKQ